MELGWAWRSGTGVGEELLQKSVAETNDCPLPSQPNCIWGGNNPDREPSLHGRAILRHSLSGGQQNGGTARRQVSGTAGADPSIGGLAAPFVTPYRFGDPHVQRYQTKMGLIPPPPPERRSEGEILKELPNTLGLVLWQELRHLRDWAESLPDVRSELFRGPTLAVQAKRREAREIAADLRRALDRFAELKVNAVMIDASEVGAACEDVVNWALKHEHTKTAIEWAEIGALVEPSNPRRANIAGRVTRNANEYERSEVWFRRGIEYAREQGDVVEQVWGHLGFGRLCQEMGWVKGARKHLSRGSHLAWKAGPPSLAASAQHDLAAMLMVRGHLEEAEQRAQRALLWYPKNHERLPYFAVDVGLMLVLGSRFAPAARIVRAALRAIEQPSVRTLALALTARAFAGMGEPEGAAFFRRRSLRMMEKHRQMETVARWHLADAYRLAGNWRAAEEEANRTLALADARNDRETERLTRNLLRLIAERRPARPKGAQSEKLRDFLRLLSARLARWSPRRTRNYAGPWGENRAA